VVELTVQKTERRSTSTQSTFARNGMKRHKFLQNLAWIGIQGVERLQRSTFNSSRKMQKNWEKEKPWEIIEVQNEDARKAFHKDNMSGFEQNEGKYRITFVKEKENACKYCKIEAVLILKNWLEAHRMAFDLIISLFLFGIVATFVLIGRLTEFFMPGVSIHNYIVYRDMGHLKKRTKEDDAGNSQRGEDTEMAARS